MKWAGVCTQLWLTGECMPYLNGNLMLAPAGYYCEYPVVPDWIWNLVFMWNPFVLKYELYLQAVFNLRGSAYFIFSLTCLNISCAFLHYIASGFQTQVQDRTHQLFIPLIFLQLFSSLLFSIIFNGTTIYLFSSSEKCRSNPLTFLITS